MDPSLTINLLLQRLWFSTLILWWWFNCRIKLFNYVFNLMMIWSKLNWTLKTIKSGWEKWNVKSNEAWIWLLTQQNEKWPHISPKLFIISEFLHMPLLCRHNALIHRYKYYLHSKPPQHCSIKIRAVLLLQWVEILLCIWVL